MSKDLTFQAEKVVVESTHYRDREGRPIVEVNVEVPDSMVETVLQNFELNEILQHFDKLDILEHIGEDFISDWLADS